MVLVDPAIKPVAARNFEAEVLVLHHPTTIKLSYQAVIVRCDPLCCAVLCCAVPCRADCVALVVVVGSTAVSSAKPLRSQTSRKSVCERVTKRWFRFVL
jgi:hypothetical protein